MEYKNYSSIIGIKNKDLLSREIKFLSYCSRIEMDGQIKEELETLSGSELDWPKLVFKAAKQGVASFLYLHLPKSEKIWLSLPEESKDMLKQVYLRTLAENWLALRELQKILVLLNQASIQVIVLKGAGLLGTVYKNIALRPMSDVDFLVERKDLSKIKSILQEAGYQKPEFLNIASLEKFGGEVHLYKKEGVFLDIHTSLSQYERFRDVFSIDSDEEIWTKSIKYNTQEGQIRILNPTHLIMHLCMHHAIAHAFSGLFRFCDLREVILNYQNEIDWHDLVVKAEQFKIKKIVHYSFILTQGLFGQILSRKLLDYLALDRKQAFFRNIFIAPKILSLPDKEPVLRKYVTQLFLMDNFLDIPKIIFRGIFPSNEWLEYRYGIKRKIELVLYRLLHPLIMIFNRNMPLSIKPTNPVAPKGND